MDRADHQPGAPHWRGYDWFRICQLHNGGAAQLRQLELLDVVMNVAAGEAMPHDRANLEQLHRSIAVVVEILRRSRRSPRPRMAVG
jgi:hypothetical protein